jgi:hypothetical protein
MNILIGGAMRSGKTQLAEALARQIGFSCLSGDCLILALRDSFPQTGVGQAGKSFDELCDAFFPFLERLLSHVGKSSRVHYVIDCHFIRPRDVKRLGADCKGLFLGFPGVVPEARVSQLRTFGAANDCYTNGMEDAELLARVNRWIEYSRVLRKECLDHQVPFLDVIGQDGSFQGVSPELAVRALGL